MRFEDILFSLDPAADCPLAPSLASELLELAETLLPLEADTGPEAGVLHRYLHVSGRFPFLQALRTREQRYRWAETAFRAILRSHYSLEDLLLQRVQMHPQHTLFREADASEESEWTYAQVARRLRTLAGLFCRVEPEPRVAIYSENSVDSACCDLACLVHRILDTPLSVHFDAETLAWIFGRLRINIAITDSEERLQRIRYDGSYWRHHHNTAG